MFCSKCGKVIENEEIGCSSCSLVQEKNSNYIQEKVFIPSWKRVSENIADSETQTDDVVDKKNSKWLLLKPIVGLLSAILGFISVYEIYSHGMNFNYNFYEYAAIPLFLTIFSTTAWLLTIKTIGSELFSKKETFQKLLSLPIILGLAVIIAAIFLYAFSNNISFITVGIVITAISLFGYYAQRNSDRLNKSISEPVVSQKLLPALLILSLASLAGLRLVGYSPYFLHSATFKSIITNTSYVIEPPIAAIELLSMKILPTPTPSPSPTPDPSIVRLEEVNNVGYRFYLGKVDYPNSPPIPDDLKNEITDVIYKSNFPKKLLPEIGIIIVNTLAVKQTTGIQTPMGLVMQLPSFPPIFLTGGGLYSQTFNNMSYVFINSSKVLPSQTGSNNQDLRTQINEAGRKAFLSSTLTHELAHHIGFKLTEEEWKEFYKLRNIPVDTPIRHSTWQLSPTEDFAEVYTNTFTGSNIKTFYGLLTKEYEFSKDPCDSLIDNIMEKYRAEHPYSYPSSGGSFADWENSYNEYRSQEEKYRKNIEYGSSVQNCRRNVLTHPDDYPELKDDFKYSMVYIRNVSKESKDFVKRVIDRLNRTTTVVVGEGTVTIPSPKKEE